VLWFTDFVGQLNHAHKSRLTVVRLTSAFVSKQFSLTLQWSIVMMIREFGKWLSPTGYQYQLWSQCLYQIYRVVLPPTAPLLCGHIT